MSRGAGAGTVLVTGGRGWLGSRLGERLRRDRPGIVCATPGRRELDCADEAAVRTALATLQPRTVVHLAGCLRRGDDGPTTAAQWRDTFQAARVITEAAAAAGVPHLVMAGTMDELGDRGGVLGPDATPRPLTTYGVCKARAREVAASAVGGQPGLRVDWFRPTTVYGPGQRGPMLIPYACSEALAGRPATFTAGTQRRDFLYVEDLLDWLVLVVDDRVGRGAVRGLHHHHLGTGVAVAVRAVLDLIAAEIPESRFTLGVRPSPTHQPAEQTVPPYRHPDPLLGSWRPKTSLVEGVSETIRWWRRAMRT